MRKTATMLALFLAAVAVGSYATSREAAAATKSITIVATDWAFTPNTIVLHVGEPTVLRLTSKPDANGVNVHGLQSDALGIPLTAIKPGQWTTVTVTPKKPGTYVLPCAIFCGLGHADMKLKVIVEK
jgi:cytochrome c oxidase subunit 2